MATAPTLTLHSFLVYSLLKRGDDKMKVVQEFQEKYNELDPDMRKDQGTQEELHARVEEMKATLLAQVENKKQEMVEKLSQIRTDGWVASRANSLLFQCARMFQFEIDRYVFTVRIAQDYSCVLRGNVVSKEVSCGGAWSVFFLSHLCFLSLSVLTIFFVHGYKTCVNIFLFVVCLGVDCLPCSSLAGRHERIRCGLRRWQGRQKGSEKRQRQKQEGHAGGGREYRFVRVYCRGRGTSGEDQGGQGICKQCCSGCH